MAAVLSRRTGTPLTALMSNRTAMPVVGDPELASGCARDVAGVAGLEAREPQRVGLPRKLEDLEHASVDPRSSRRAS